MLEQEPKVRVADRRNGDTHYSTIDLEAWLGNVLLDGHLEARTSEIGSTLIRTIDLLVRKGLLSVTEVIEITREVNVWDAALPEPGVV